MYFTPKSEQIDGALCKWILSRTHFEWTQCMGVIIWVQVCLVLHLILQKCPLGLCQSGHT